MAIKSAVSQFMLAAAIGVSFLTGEAFSQERDCGWETENPWLKDMNRPSSGELWQTYLTPQEAGALAMATYLNILPPELRERDSVQKTALDVAHRAALDHAFRWCKKLPDPQP